MIIIKKVLFGMIIGITIAFSTQALASELKQLIVAELELDIYLNGKKVSQAGTYDRGTTKVPLALNYKDTIYVPITFLTNLFDKNTVWDQTSNRLHINDEQASPNLFTINDLKTQTIYEKTYITPLDKAFFVGDSYQKQLFKNYISISGSTTRVNFRRLNSSTKKNVTKNGAIFVHVPGSHEFKSVDDSYLPMTTNEINNHLENKNAFVYIQETNGTIQLLFAAKNNTYLEEILAKGFGKKIAYVTNNNLVTKHVTPFVSIDNQYIDSLAPLSFIVDLRQSKGNGTAIVYAESHNQRTSKLSFTSTDFIDRPDNLFGIFNPNTGDIKQKYVLVEDKQSIPLENGKLVYEVRPYSAKDTPRSMIKKNVAFIRLSALLPDIEENTPIAVRFILPYGWSGNIPHYKNNGWYLMYPKEIKNQYLAFGSFFHETLTINNSTISLDIPKNIKYSKRRDIKEYVENVLSFLIGKFGEPPTEFNETYSITILPDDVVNEASGYRTVVSNWDEKELTHNLIHWWVGVTMDSEIKIWSEAGSEYLAVKTLKEMGIWTQTQYNQFMKEKYTDEAIALMRDLDELIIKNSNGMYSLEDAIKEYHKIGKDIYDHKPLSIKETANLIKNVTGVDVKEFISKRYQPN